ncbi:ydjO [Escherichia coli]|nr:ydjO [Escherichia coli]
MMSLWDALRMNMMISYQELVRTFPNGMFIGVISNDPGIVTNVEYGQEWKIKKEDISDWMYTRGDKIYGGYTIDPLLVTYPKEEADELRAKLVR